MGKFARTHRDLELYKQAFGAAAQVFEVTKAFPAEERFALTIQVRKSSRSVCANLAEAWRKRRYEPAFLAKLNDVEGEAAETQVWLEFAVQHKYLQVEKGRELYAAYEKILGRIVNMINDPAAWLLPGAKRRK